MRARIAWAWRWFWFILVRNGFTIAVASLIWLVWRSGTQPRRLAYPCQQAAAANLGVLAVLFVPGIARRRRTARGTVTSPLVELATGSVALAGILFVLISAGVAVYSDYGDVYTPGNPATIDWQPVDVSAPADMSPRLLVPNGSEAVVAVNRNPAVTYGMQPYGPGPDSAYDLTWQTVADLHFGPPDNPLKDLVADVDGDGTIEVLIKPNTVRYFSNDGTERSPVYSHPAIVRPLVDMLAKAGAQQILVGDGSDGTGGLFSKMDQQGFTQAYFNQLGAPWPGTTVARVDFQNLSRWSWVDMGADAGEAGASAYFGSGYSDSDLVKAHDHASYFAASDPHGRPGPGQSNCMGWEAVSDYLLDADLIIDLAKLKVHYYGVNTAMLKNWVGITMFSTFNMSEDYWARICHEPYEPTDYEKTFGNDFIWREIVDLHRGVLYWRSGAVHPTPQRRYLCIMDAINCGERYHDPDKPWPYWLHTMMASVDPVAIDAVGARLQRYDFRMIPIINNAHASSIGSAWAIGTGDPGQVRVVGGTMIDGTYDHQFLFDDRHGTSWPDWADTFIQDLLAPQINSVTAQDTGDSTWLVQADISDAHAAFYYYGDDGSDAPKVVRLGKAGQTFSATIPDVGAGSGRVVAQDEYFNTASAPIINMPAIGLSTDRLNHTVYCDECPLDDTFTVTNIGTDTLSYSVTRDQSWLDVTPRAGSSTGEPDTITVSYVCHDLLPGVYTGTLTVASEYAANSPQTIEVTVVVQTVLPDLDRDCDVDQSDFGLLQVCFDTPGVPQTDPRCAACDMDGDGVCDQDDVAILRGCMSGANVAADKDCAAPWSPAGAPE